MSPDRSDSASMALQKNCAPAEFTMAEDYLGHVLSRVHTRLAQMLSKETQSELGVTGTQAWILYLLASGRCVTATGLAHECGIDLSAVTRLLDRVELLGFVRRVRSAKDRRVVQIELTETGRNVAVRVPAIAGSVVERVQAGMTPAEIGFLVSLLRQVDRNCDW
ncbi:DNA-binding transcriptional regulator, MarR family [Paraburkholderia hospita]|nr:DNA-binding transcriptional regulator, MarR family [Paraburkholderia hospita]SKD05750.1 DNA-binding transcriptional regulator, MarR family [Paraburkholderia hospita]